VSSWYGDEQSTIMVRVTQSHISQGSRVSLDLFMVRTFVLVKTLDVQDALNLG